MIEHMIKLRQEETFSDMLELLQIHGRCAVIRPTGFGKTYLLSRLVGQTLRENRGTNTYKNILYVYPSKIVKQAVLDYLSTPDRKGLIDSEDISKIKFMSYYKLGLLCKHNREDLVGMLLSSYNMVVFDEMQYMGAFNVQDGLVDILPFILNEDIKYIGASATPIRTDGVNVVQKFFNNINTRIYTLENFVNDGIIEKPWYIFSSYIAKRHFENNELYKKLPKEKAIKIANRIGELYNCDSVLQRNISNAAKQYNMDLSYMKFICFFLEKKQIKEKASVVIGYFKKAFPGRKIRALIIHSDKEYIDNIDKLDRFRRTPGTIDLVFSINMLNLGYHVGDITGVLMFRNTKSTVIYPQQIGRAISVQSKYPALIFDFVGNFNISPIIKDNKEKQEELTKDTENLSRLRIQDKVESSFMLIDELKEFEDYLSRLEISSENTISKAINWYLASDDSGVPGSKYGMSLEEVQRAVGPVGIIHNIIKEMKRRGYQLLEYDKEQWGAYYEQC